MFYRERDETFDYIMGECCRLAQKKYKMKHIWTGNIIYRELIKKLKFDHTAKWYIYIPE